ncbi:MAG: peptidoglycan-binding protein [Clostridium sp.]|nr:peptidoglycan-binding protein [Clostridium sp.]
MLIEVCFVNSVKDVEIYKSKFEDICKTIAETLVGEIKVQSNNTQNNNAQSTTVNKQETVVKGDPWVRSLQEECNKQGFSNQVVDGIAGKNTLAGLPVLQQGAKGNITKLLQKKLTALGFSTTGADGIFGNWTRTAVIKYQKNKGLSADGIVGQNTWKSLLGL